MHTCIENGEDRLLNALQFSSLMVNITLLQLWDPLRLVMQLIREEVSQQTL